MATKQELKHYVGLWLQAGKRLESGGKLLDTPAVRGLNGYSTEFNQFWESIWEQRWFVYLSLTDCSIGELEAEEWEIKHCANCRMPSAVKIAGLTELHCICGDIYLWPNTELPLPRVPGDDSCRLQNLIEKLSRELEDEEKSR
jgi:hypothetical protein